MTAIIVIICALIVLAALAGGYLALRYKKNLHLLLGFVAGLMLGVVAFELLPEIFQITSQTSTNIAVPMASLVVGFLGIHVVEKLAAVHTNHEQEYKAHSHRHVGKFSAGALIAHRLLDGISIGLALQVNATLGIAVSVAVIAHSFMDGLNISGILLKHKNSSQTTKWFTLIGALAPVAGIIFASVIRVPEWFLLVFLGSFAGLLLYVAASDILPEAHSDKPSKAALGLTVIGILLMYILSVFTQVSWMFGNSSGPRASHFSYWHPWTTWPTRCFGKL